MGEKVPSRSLSSNTSDYEMDVQDLEDSGCNEILISKGTPKNMAPNKSGHRAALLAKGTAGGTPNASARGTPIPSPAPARGQV